MTNPSGGLTDNAAVKIPVPLQDVAVWSIFIPKKDLRAYPGAIRGTEEWDNTYKIRTVVERGIYHIKEHLCLAGRRTQNETLHADLILTGITQLITVVLADKINCHKYIRSLKRSFTGLSFAITYFIISYTQVPALTHSTACLRRRFAIYFHNFMRWQTTPDLF